MMSLNFKDIILEPKIFGFFCIISKRGKPFETAGKFLKISEINQSTLLYNSSGSIVFSPQTDISYNDIDSTPSGLFQRSLEAFKALYGTKLEKLTIDAF